MRIADCIASYDFCVPKGGLKTFAVAVVHDGSPVSLAGYDAKLTAIDYRGALALALTVGHGLSIDEAAGTVTVVVRPSDTVDSTWRDAAYDLLIWVPGEEIDRYLVAGTITLNRTVTHR